MIWIALIILVVTSLFMSAFFSGAETGLYCTNRVRLHMSVQQDDMRAIRLSRLLADEHGALTSLLVGVNIMDFVLTGSVAYILGDILNWSATRVEFFTVAIATPLLFVFANVVPKNLFQLRPNSLMLAGSGLLLWSDRLIRATGIVALLRRLTQIMEAAVGAPAAEVVFEPRRRVAAMIHESLAGQAHSADQAGLIDRVLSLAETSIQSAMVPAAQVVGVSAHATRAELIRWAKSSTHARLPVYDGFRRSIVGVASVDDFLADDAWFRVQEKMEKPLFLSPHATVVQAIAELKSSKKRMGIVVDDAKLMIGLVTMRRLLALLTGTLSKDD